MRGPGQAGQGDRKQAKTGPKTTPKRGPLRGPFWGPRHRGPERQPGEGQGPQGRPGGPKGAPKRGRKGAKIGPFLAPLGPLRGPKGKEPQKGSLGRVRAPKRHVRGASPPDTPPKGGGEQPELRLLIDERKARAPGC